MPLAEIVTLWRAGLLARAELFSELLVASSVVGFAAARASVPIGELDAFDVWARSVVHADPSSLVGLDAVTQPVFDEAREHYAANGHD